ncbi:hypothetical protein E0Z10_g5501 [Xylaria hypoxylon]|uniref:Uncharacterized protein n=1 Tax=Xylaria hypoxylon TaxID=37992 RepID=A0A4Z0Z3Q8_9PEZI|nr:hypothetical protein E0Z10_g5501 [Xylaria hypoxylon]
MSMKSSVEIFTEPVSLDVASHVAIFNHHPQTGSQFSHRELQSMEISNKYTHHDEDIVDSSSSSSYPVQDAPFDIDKPSPDARSRATLFLEKYNTQHRDGESNDEQSCPSSLPSSTPSESVRLSNVVNCNSWSETTPDQKRADEDEIKQVTVYCHHVPSNESGQSRNANTSGAITRTFEDAMPPDTWENKGITNIRLSLRGGGSDTIWAQPKDKQRGRPTLSYRGGGGHAALKANGTNKLQRPEATAPPLSSSSSSSSAFSPSSDPSSVSSKSFITPVAQFKFFSASMQSATYSYLAGDVATHPASDLSMPLMEMFHYLRYSLLLLIESENPPLKDMMRSTAEYARFRDGLSASPLLPDSAFVVGVRGENPRLDGRLGIWWERMRIVWAFQTVDFPGLMHRLEEPKSEGDGEEDKEPKRAKIDWSGLGDLDMRP